MLQPHFPIATKRLKLRPLAAADTDELLAYRARADCCRWVPFTPMTTREIADRLAGAWAATELTAQGQSLTLGVQIAGDGPLIGDVVLFWHSEEHRSGELGYMINPAYGGHGYATEAAAAMLHIGFVGLGLHRITARIDARNESSLRLASRLGMRREAHLLQNELFKGEWCDEIDFAMLAAEWPGSAAAAIVQAPVPVE